MKGIFSSPQKWWADTGLQTKFTAALMTLILVPAVFVGVFFYSRLYDMVVADTIRKEQDISAKTAPLIENTVNSVLNAAQTVSSLSFYRTLFEEGIDMPFSTAAGSSQAEKFHEDITRILKNSILTGFQIYVDLPNEDSELFTGEYTKDIFAPLSHAKGTYWYGIFQGTGASSLFCPPFYLGEQEQHTYGNEAYIRTDYLRYHNSTLKVYIACYYSSDNFEQILKDSLALSGSVSYIVNERDNMVAYSNSSLSGIYWLDYNTIKSSFMSSNSFIEKKILEDRVYAGFYNIDKTGWFLVTILPSAPLIQKSNEIIVQFALIYAGFVLVASILANILSHSIANRISSVIRQMKKVKEGPPVPMESPDQHDEVGDLIDTYNYMTRKMEQLMENQAKAAEDLRIAEFRSLQAQINPHFLYNTMDMINWLAQQGRTSEISNAVQNLSRFYKLTLSRKESLSTIESEEEHISIYIHIQTMRFHASISFISDIPDELMDFSIPKLTLQPVVENSILHGIMEKPSKSGTIVLTGWREGGDIVLLISDDGVGIPPEKLSHILSGKGRSSSGGSNIAIYNTHRRLQILYGEKYGLSYQSTEGSGTEVQIRLPARQPQDEKNDTKGNDHERDFTL